MRHDDAVRQRHQRMVGRQRLRIGDVEAGGEDLAVAQRSRSSASGSTTGPRDVFTSTAVGFMARSASASMR